MNQTKGLSFEVAGIKVIIEMRIVDLHPLPLTMDSISDLIAINEPLVRRAIADFFRVDENGALSSDATNTHLAIAKVIETEQTRQAAVYAARSKKGNQARWGEKRCDTDAAKRDTAETEQSFVKIAQKNGVPNSGQPVDNPSFSVDKFFLDSPKSKKSRLSKDSLKDPSGKLEGLLMDEKSSEQPVFTEVTKTNSLENHPPRIPEGTFKEPVANPPASRASSYACTCTREERSKDKTKKEYSLHHQSFFIELMEVLRKRGFVGVDNFATEFEKIANSGITREEVETVLNNVIQTKKKREGVSVDKINMPYVLKALNSAIQIKELAKDSNNSSYFTSKKCTYNPDEEEKERIRQERRDRLRNLFAQGLSPWSDFLLPDPEDPEAKGFDFDDPLYVQMIKEEQERWEREGRGEEGRKVAERDKKKREAEWAASKLDAELHEAKVAVNRGDENRWIYQSTIHDE